jgi:predicted RNase H-like HicB family nuclease
MNTIQIIIEQHEDGFIGYPLGFKAGAIIGQGDSYEEALADTRSAINFFIDHYGAAIFHAGFDHESPLVNAFLTETAIAV